MLAVEITNMVSLWRFQASQQLKSDQDGLARTTDWVIKVCSPEYFYVLLPILQT